MVLMVLHREPTHVETRSCREEHCSDGFFRHVSDRLSRTSSLASLYNTVVDLVDTQVGPQRQALSPWAEALDVRLARLETKVTQLYGVGRGSLDAGVIDLDFLEKGD